MTWGASSTVARMRIALLCLLVFGLRVLRSEEEPKSFFGIPIEPASPETTGKTDAVDAAAAARPLPPELAAIRESIGRGEQVMKDIFNKRMADLRTAITTEVDKAA